MWHKTLRYLKIVYKSTLVFLVVMIWAVGFYYFVTAFFEPVTESVLADNSSLSSDLLPETEDCNTYGISLTGDIVTYYSNDAYSDQDKLMYDQISADEVIYYMNQAEENPNIKAVIVEISSYGGSGEAGEEIMRAFRDSKKPVVAFIRDAGLSAAYLAATGAQTIFASKFSDVGSIGITMSYIQNSEKNAKDGYTYVALSSGVYKDSGNPDKPITEAEKQLFMRDIGISFDYFVSIVSKNRNLSIEKVKSLADGSSLMGEQALKSGLIDKIGLLPDVKNYLAEKIGSPVEICWQN